MMREIPARLGELVSARSLDQAIVQADLPLEAGDSLVSACKVNQNIAAAEVRCCEIGFQRDSAFERRERLRASPQVLGFRALGRRKVQRGNRKAEDRPGQAEDRR